MRHLWVARRVSFLIDRATLFLFLIDREIYRTGESRWEYFRKLTITYDDCNFSPGVGFESIRRANKPRNSNTLSQLTEKLRSYELIYRFSDCPTETKQLREICHPGCRWITNWLPVSLWNFTPTRRTIKRSVVHLPEIHVLSSSSSSFFFLFLL